MLERMSEPGNVDALRYAVEAGVPVSAGDVFGWTPAHSAAQGGCAECVRILAGAGAGHFGNPNS